MVDEAVKLSLAPPEGHLQGVQGEARAQVAGGLPTDDEAAEGIDHEGRRDEARRGAHGGQVGKPQAVRGLRGEVAADEVGRPGRLRVGDRRAPPLAAHRALAAQLPPHLAGAVDAVVLLIDAADLAGQLLIAQGPRARGPRPRRVVGRRGDRQYGADRLDPEALRVLLDEGAHRLPRRSSSAPKKGAALSEDRVGPPQLAHLTLKLFDALALGAREPGPQALIGLGLAHPRTQGLRCHAELAGDRADRRSLRVVLALVLEDHAHGPFPHFCWIPRCSAHGSILSRAGASKKLGDSHSVHGRGLRVLPS